MRTSPYGTVDTTVLLYAAHRLKQDPRAQCPVTPGRSAYEEASNMHCTLTRLNSIANRVHDRVVPLRSVVIMRFVRVVKVVDDGPLNSLIF